MLQRIKMRRGFYHRKTSGIIRCFTVCDGDKMRREKWVVAAKKADFERIGKQFGIDPVVARIIRNRDIEGDAEIARYLHGTLSQLHDPCGLYGMDSAVKILNHKIADKKRIRVIGDYDVDGIMSSYILLKGLMLLGADADVVIPHRVQDGYGLNDDLIENAHRDGVDTILTCDNGIAAYSQVELANRMGMTVVVTDHHEVPYEDSAEGKEYILPPAAAVIDPKQPGCSYPFKGICGAVVAFKLMQELLGKVPEDFIEMAAFATVCDVMELVDENRILVKYGLKAMEHSHNIGLAALIEVCGLQEKSLSAYHVGFILGPCMNATGRLDTAKRALKLLLTDTHAEAVSIAVELKNLNESRKEMTAYGVEQAVRIIEEKGLADRKVLILYLPECHESLAGIIAGRIREMYGRPVFVLTNSEGGIKGSGRSIEAYSMYEELNKCKELFTRYGGHKMAAGVSMDAENLDEFARRMEEECRLTPEDYVEKVRIDVPMPFSYVNEELIRQLSLLEPFGNGNPKPLFAQRNLTLDGVRVFGKNQNVGKYRVSDEYGGRYELTYFGEQEDLQRYWNQKGKISVTYYPQINVYRGSSQIQFVIQNYQ